MCTIEKVIEKDNGYAVFRLRSERLDVLVTNLGCRLLSWRMHDLKKDAWEEMILGLADPAHVEDDGTYMGAVVGRVANRVRGASFTLDGEIYALSKNQGEHQLHGGFHGFDKRLFSATTEADGIVFRHVSPDMEEGYPGTLQVEISYRLAGDTLTFACSAVSDRDTIVNISTHTYFNLSGSDAPIWDHSLRLPADRYLPIDADYLPTGEALSVAGTAFDYRTDAVLGEKIDWSDAQIDLARGYDHAFCLQDSDAPIVLRHPASGRTLEIRTDRPMAHVYTGNYLADGPAGRSGTPYANWTGIALEPELCPDSIHVEKEPAVILRKGETFHTQTRFTCKIEA